MVLSNKKLKQKLREQLSRSILSSESKSSASFSTNPQSFRQLIGAATHKPKLSKREKRRENVSLSNPEALTEAKGGDNGVVGEAADAKPARQSPIDDGNEVGIGIESRSKKKERKKKRKRDEGDGEVGLEGSLKKEGDIKEGKKTPKTKKKKGKKGRKKKKKKVGEEPGKGAEVVSGEKGDQLAQKDNVSDSQGNEEVSNKVYVGGIPYYSTEDDIRSFFDQCGTITEVDCMRFPESGKFRGIAILSFKTEEAAKRALALDGADMGGFFLKIQCYNKTTRVAKTPNFCPPAIQGYNRIYAGNLSWDISEDDLRNLFSDCSVSSIRFGEDKETGEFKGYAHVDFSDSTSLEKALKLDQKVVYGRPVRITCAVALRKGQAHQSTSKGAVDNNNHLAEGAVDNNSGLSTGKMRRRTCYECGEKGHISSACPKKPIADPTDSNTG